eukprot:gene11930-13898_t
MKRKTSPPIVPQATASVQETDHQDDYKSPISSQSESVQPARSWSALLVEKNEKEASLSAKQQQKADQEQYQIDMARQQKEQQQLQQDILRRQQQLQYQQQQQQQQQEEEEETDDSERAPAVPLENRLTIKSQRNVKTYVPLTSRIIHSKVPIEQANLNISVVKSSGKALKKIKQTQVQSSNQSNTMYKPKPTASSPPPMPTMPVKSTVLRKHVAKTPKDQGAKQLSSLLAKVGNFDDILNTLGDALVDNPPFSRSEGGFIQSGFSVELDEYHKLCHASTQMMPGIQDSYRSKLKIPSLKIRRNDTIGYFFELPSTSTIKLPPSFFHVQTLSSCIRHKNSELVELEDKIKVADRKAIEIEGKIFDELCVLVGRVESDIKKASEVMAELDISCNFAKLASDRNYTRPKMTNKPILNISHGRHPTIEIAQGEKHQSIKSFVTNDCLLGKDSNSLIWLITGPNMGGKSTFLRQNALIAIMAQVGSFVPAEQAEIGVFDAVFSRVGSSDDLANDRSTFMVEMEECASILKRATSNSLVVMDEVGRGTSTLDGLAIAQSVVEHLYTTECPTLFATHHHELTDLSNSMKHLQCHALAVKEEDNDLLFSYKILPGISKKSYAPSSSSSKAVDLFLDSSHLDLSLLEHSEPEPLSLPESNFDGQILYPTTNFETQSQHPESVQSDYEPTTHLRVPMPPVAYRKSHRSYPFYDSLVASDSDQGGDISITFDDMFYPQKDIAK